MEKNHSIHHFISGCKVKHIPWKRAFDVGFSFLVLTILSPVFLLISLAIRFSSTGAAVYKQKRIGRGGKPFDCYKFRTMFQDADERLNILLQTDPKIRKEWQSYRKIKNDPRITPIGKFLRKTSLDELPQFWNVLKGDLSIVGPRPVVAEEIEQHFGAKAARILSVRPGITGLWQVSGRNDTSYKQRIKLDEMYVHKYSLALDLSLIIQTLPVMINARGAY